MADTQRVGRGARSSMPAEPELPAELDLPAGAPDVVRR
jgi:hypothetical protein